MKNVNYILKQIKAGQISRAELSNLITQSVKISHQFLIKKKGQYSIKALSDGSELYEICLEAITPLFINASNGNLQLENSLNNWEKPIEDEAAAAYFLHKIVWKRTEQHIYSLLKESDPVFHKIHRSIDNQVKEQGYSKISIFGTTYIIESDRKDSLNRISSEEFEKIPDSYFFVTRKELLKNIFNYLKKETEYQPFIPLNTLVRKLKMIAANEYTYSVPSANHIPLDFDVDNVLASSLKLAEDKLTHYHKLNRLNEEEAEKFRKALNDIASDLKNGGLSSGMIDYLEPYFPGIDNKELNSKYYSILDYLIRVMKKEIIKEYEA